MVFLANFYLVRFISSRRGEFDIIYFRDESLFFTAFWARLFMRKMVFFEIHSVLGRWYRQLMNIFSVYLANGVVAISSGLKQYYKKINSNILVSLCSAAEESWFDYSKSKEDWRNELKLPNDVFIMGYTGVIGANPNNDYYEVDDIVRSLLFLPKEIIFVVVGELNNNGLWLRQIAQDIGVSERLLIIPWQERSVVSKYLLAFDLVLIPKRKKNLVGDSPAKMFPALASCRPIVAGRAECIEEVLTNGQDSLIVEVNSPEGWAKAISQVYKDQDLAEMLSKQAWITKNNYTWGKRGSNIEEFIKQTIKMSK